MRFYPIKTPEVVQRMYPEYLWRFSSNEKNIYLTFDDGPTPDITEFVLDQLKAFDAKATFFCIGKNVNQYPCLFKKIMENGHSVGNHTYNHLKGWSTLRNVYLENTLKAQKVIEKKTPASGIGLQTSKIFRPPYGKIRKKQSIDLQNHGFKIVMWDVLSADWDRILSKDRCLKNVIGNSNSGSIIVFHDSKKAEKNLRYALPRVLTHFAKEGYSFKRID